MSDKQSIAKLELLPNEVLIKCFQYLSAIDIFYSFDLLNLRLDNLIRNIPLQWNIEDVDEFTLGQFGFTVLSDSRVKRQIISLKVSDRGTPKTIRTLLAFISLNESSPLRSLIFNDFDSDLLSRVMPMLPLLTNLRYLHVSGPSSARSTTLLSRSGSIVPALPISSLFSDFSLVSSLTSLISLSVSNCYVEDLCNFFQHSPNIQSLNIKNIFSGWHTLTPLANHTAIHLKRIVIDSDQLNFNICEILFKRTPNLKCLIIACKDSYAMADASRWQELITSLLPHLDVFKFQFAFPIVCPCGLDLIPEHYELAVSFHEFQTDFWRQQHRWYVECVFNKCQGLFYTVPYMLKEYEVMFHSDRFYNESFKRKNTFDEVFDARIFNDAFAELDEFYLPNVRLLVLCNDFTYDYGNRDHSTSYLYDTEVLKLSF